MNTRFRFRNAALRICGVVIGVLAACVSGVAQTAATGIIKGRVEEKTTARSLENARVTLAGTNREVFTNEFGEYLLASVPAGPAKLVVFYTGLATETATVTVPAGGTVQRDIALVAALPPAARTSDEVLQLDAFVVAGARENSAAALAVNEQRYADNLKTVMSTDSMGDITQNNIGEFVKYLPGVNIDTDQMNVLSVGMRGMSAAYTTIAMDGAGVAAAGSGGTGRTTLFQAISLNNAARIEVVKVPTPDMPASSVGGSINLVSRNAFELRRPETRYRVYANMNSRELRLGRQPGGNMANKDSKVHHIVPSFEFNHTNPLTERLGFSINAVVNQQYNVARRTNRTFAATVAAANPRKPTVADPYLQSFNYNIFPVFEHRYTIGTRLDWKISPVDTLSFSYSGNYLHQDYEQHSFTFNTGNNPSDWGPDYTRGGTGLLGSANIGLVTRYARVRNNIVRLTYRHIGTTWDINAGLGGNDSLQWYRSVGYGQWETTSARIRNLNLSFDGYSDYSPGRVTATDATGAPVDLFNLGNYRLFLGNASGNTNTATRDNTGISVDARIDAKRKFFTSWFTGALKVGANAHEAYRARRWGAQSMTYVGADGIADTADDAIARAPIPLLDEDFLSVKTVHGYPPFPFPSSKKAYDLYLQYPQLWSYTSTNLINDIRELALGSDQAKERIDAAFAMAEAKFLQNRLRLVGGVRWEKTTDYGRVCKIDNNAQYRKDAAGNLILDANNRPQPVSTDPAVLNRLIYQRLGTEVRASYSDYYPSLNATCNFTENLLLRVGLAKTVGRPDIGNIIGTTQVTTADFDPESVKTGSALGSISTKNAALKPYTAKALDVQFEYYTPQGGVFSAGYFRKQIKDFFANRTFLATSEFLQTIGLSDDYVDYAVTAPFNTVGLTHITGGEFNVTQPLGNIAGALRGVRVFANYTRTRISGVDELTFRGYTPFSWNGGFFASSRKFRHEPASLNLAS
jgi:TonB-dependent receptor